MYTVIVSLISIMKSFKLKFFSWAWWEESVPNTFICTGRQNHAYFFPKNTAHQLFPKNTISPVICKQCAGLVGLLTLPMLPYIAV